MGFHKWTQAHGEAVDNALIAGAAFGRCSIECSVRILNQSCYRNCTVGATAGGAETVKRGERASGTDAEYCAAASVTERAGPAIGCHSVEVAIGALHHPRPSSVPLRPGEGMQRGKRAG